MRGPLSGVGDQQHCRGRGNDLPDPLSGYDRGKRGGAHLAKAKKNIRYAEIVGPTRIARDVASGLAIRGKKILVGDGPGLGISVNRSLLEGGIQKEVSGSVFSGRNRFQRSAFSKQPKS